MIALFYSSFNLWFLVSLKITKWENVPGNTSLIFVLIFSALNLTHSVSYGERKWVPTLQGTRWQVMYHPHHNLYSAAMSPHRGRHRLFYNASPIAHPWAHLSGWPTIIGTAVFPLREKSLTRTLLLREFIVSVVLQKKSFEKSVPISGILENVNYTHNIITYILTYYFSALC